MKRLIIFLLTLITINSFGQRFFVQPDNSTYFGCNLQGLTSDQECDGLDLLQQGYIRHTLNMASYQAGDRDNGLETRYNRGFRILLNVIAGGNQPKMFPEGADLTQFLNKLDAYLRTQTNDGWFYYEAVTVAVIENEPFNQNYYDYPRTSVKAYLGELEGCVTVCHRYNVKISDGASHIAYYNSIMNTPPTGTSVPARADSAFRRYPNSYNAIQLDFANWHTNVPFSTLSLNDSTMRPGRLAEWTDSLRTWVNHPNIIDNEFHQEPEEQTGDPQSTPSQIDQLCFGIVTEQRKARLRYVLNFGGDLDGAGGCGVLSRRALPIINNTTVQLCHLGVAYRDAVLTGE